MAEEAFNHQLARIADWSGNTPCLCPKTPYNPRFRSFPAGS